MDHARYAANEDVGRMDEGVPLINDASSSFLSSRILSWEMDLFWEETRIIGLMRLRKWFLRICHTAVNLIVKLEILRRHSSRERNIFTNSRGREFKTDG